MTPLTSCELRILFLVAEGKTSDNIAVVCHCSPRTVEWHKRNIKEKLNACNMAHAIAVACQSGILK